jgi:hypothetical protein
MFAISFWTRLLMENFLFLLESCLWGLYPHQGRQMVGQESGHPAIRKWLSDHQVLSYLIPCYPDALDRASWLGPGHFRL